jgi:hypothetical protein
MSTRAETNRIKSVPMKGYGSTRLQTENTTTTSEKVEEMNSMQGK